MPDTIPKFDDYVKTIQPPVSRGGTLAQRNNNPGNLRPVGKGGFRSFATPEEGFQALRNDLTAKMTGRTRTGLHGGSTLYDLFGVLAPTGDKDNNPKIYAENVARKLNVHPTTRIGELQPRVGEIAEAMAAQEGYYGRGGINRPITPQAPANIPKFDEFAKSQGIEEDIPPPKPLISSLSLGLSDQEPPKVAPIRPNVTSTVREDVDFTEPQTPVAPIKFEAFDTSRDLSIPARLANAAGVIGGVDNPAERMAATNPTLRGKPVTVTIKPHSATPTYDEYADALMAAIGPSAVEANRKYRAETGRNLATPDVSLADLEQYRNGRSYTVPVAPTQALYNLINAYNEGGLEKAKQVASGMEGENRQFAASEQGRTPTDVNPIRKGLADAALGTSRLINNVRGLAGSESAARDAQYIEDTAGAIPEPKSTGGKIVRGLTGGAASLPTYIAAGPAAPLVAYTENLHKGPEEAITDALKFNVFQGVAHGAGTATEGMSNLGRQLTARGAAATTGVGLDVLSGERDPTKLLEAGVVAAGMPIGKRRGEEPVARREGLATVEESISPETRQALEQMKGGQPNEVAPAEGVVADTATPSPPRHVDLQARRKRGPEAGNFRKETRAETEERRAQVEGKNADPYTQLLDSMSFEVPPIEQVYPKGEENVRPSSPEVVSPQARSENAPRQDEAGAVAIHEQGALSQGRAPLVSPRAEPLAPPSKVEGKEGRDSVLAEIEGKGILPRQVAEDVLRKRGINDPSLVDYVEQKTADVYKANEGFRKQLNSKDPRGFYRQFVDSWIEGEHGRRTKQSRQGQEPIAPIKPIEAEPIREPAKGVEPPAETEKANAQAGAIDVDLLTLGVRPFAKDVASKGRGMFTGIKETSEGIKSMLAPATRSPEARATANVVRAEASQMARRHDIAEKSLEGAQKHFAKQKPEANYDFIDRMEKGEGQADPKTQGFADALRSLLDQRRDQIQALGTGKLESFIENYFPHIWKDPKSAKNVFSTLLAKRPLEGSRSFLKQRKIPLTKEGLDLGLEPVSTNPVDLTILKLHEMDRYLMAHKVMQEMKAQGNLKYVKATERVPEGYAKIDDRVATVYGGPDARPEGGQLIRGYYVAPEPAAKILNNYLSPGINATMMKAPYQAWRAVANTMNQAQLGLSFFHAGFTTLDVMVSRTAAGLEDIFRHGNLLRGTATIASTPVAPVTNLVRGSRMLKEWYSPGSQGAEVGQLVNAMAEAGGRARMDKMYSNDAVKRFKDAAKAGNIIGAVLRLPSAAIEKAASPVMEWLVPRQKLGIFAEMGKRELERLGPGATREQTRDALAKAWDSVDNRMGQMVYDNLFWNKTLKDLSMASVRSVGWNLGTAREVFGGAGQYATLPIRAMRKSRTDPLFTHKMAYAAALPLVVGSLGAMTQYLLTGKGPEELKDYFFPQTGTLDENGNPERISFPSYMKDIFHVREAPGKVVTSKLHPLIGLIGEMLANEDYYGTKIRNEDDPLMTQLIDTAKHAGKAFTPFAVRGYQKETEREAPLSRRILPFVGITPAPSYIDQSPAEKLMSEKLRERMPQGSRTKEEAERSRLRHQLQSKVRKGQDITNDLESGIRSDILKPTDRRDIYRDAEKSPQELRFNRLGIEDAVEVYEVMSETERTRVRPLLIKKADGIDRLKVSDQELVKRKLDRFGISAGRAQRRPITPRPSLLQRPRP